MKTIDILSEDSYAKEHIPGSINISVYKTSFVDDVKALNEKEVIIYGYSDETQETAHAKELLEAEGIKVHVLEGGLKGYQGETHSKDTTTLQGKHELSQESRIEWTGRNIGNKHIGSVTIKRGFCEFKDNKIVNGEVVIDMTKMDNFDIKDDSKNYLIKHLQSSDFFQVDKYPIAIISLKAIEYNENRGSLPNTTVTADLTIKDQTHEITFDAIHRKNELSAHFDIDRTKWNVQYGSEKFFARLGMHIIEDEISFDVLLKLDE